MQGILALLSQAFGLLLTVPAPLDASDPFADHPPGVPGRHLPSTRLLHAPQALKMQKLYRIMEPYSRSNSFWAIIT
jgi:hypothetical protein